MMKLVAVDSLIDRTRSVIRSHSRTYALHATLTDMLATRA